MRHQIRCIELSRSLRSSLRLVSTKLRNFSAVYRYRRTRMRHLYPENGKPRTVTITFKGNVELRVHLHSRRIFSRSSHGSVKNLTVHRDRSYILYLLFFFFSLNRDLKCVAYAMQNFGELLNSREKFFF